MKIIVREICLLAALVILLAFVLGAQSIGPDSSVSADGRVDFIIDAGHGGEDCGAIGLNGVYEKDINLVIARSLCDSLNMLGYRAIMTRTEDRLMYTEEQNIYGQRKIYDLRNRLEVANSYPDAVFISIHMNYFEIQKYKGMMVYYSVNNPESHKLALAVQSRVAKDIQTDNNRKVKAAGENIYLLHHAKNAAVLIECGFLSNPEECEKLSDKDYQRALSFSVLCGIIDYKETISKG